MEQMEKKAERKPMKTSKAGICSSRAFTLFEILLVVFLLSLIAALSFPAFSRIGEGRLKSDAKRAASILRYINDTAIARKETLTLHFNLDSSTASWQAEEGQKKETLESLRYVSLPSRGEVREGELSIFFGPLGAPEDISLRFEEEAGGMTVALNRMSGRVKITGDEDEKH
jgi:Tfp pilus assembly protein FimT